MPSPKRVSVIVQVSKLAAILSAIYAVILPSLVWAGCQYADGTAAPEPGPSPEALHSKSWGPKLKVLFNNLSDGEKSNVLAVMETPDAALLTMKCSNNDLFWIHLSLVGMSEVEPDSLPELLADKGRAWKLTGLGYRTLPALLRSDAMRQ